MIIDARTPLGRRIKILRVAKGLRQRDLADIAGLSDSAISLIETGTRKPRDLELAAILKALGARREDVGLPEGAA